MIVHHKHIIVDFDDTLAFHENRNFDDAKPNIPLISKLNSLYHEGWEISIYTARGSISCKTRKEAEKKYKNGMVAWLAKHDVRYTRLSFEKPLAAYYIDDKGITPENFLEIDIRKLEGGLSGSDIYTDGKFVHKKDINAHLTRKWFDEAIGINTPTIHRIVGDTITMDYIDHDENYFQNNFYVALGIIQTQIEKMKSIKSTSSLTFDAYRNRIREHANQITMAHAGDKEKINDICSKLDSIWLESSFSHGDFGIKNMLFTNNDVYLIDPICTSFGCTELDVAKFIASLYINQFLSPNIGKTFDLLSVANGINRDILKTLVQAEIARVYKYHSDKPFIMRCIRNVHERE